MDKVTVVIIDDHPSTRRGVAVDLGDRFDVVAVAADVASGIAAVQAHRPDVVVCDVQLPGGGGAEVVNAVRDMAPVVMFSVTTDKQAVIECISAGAKGYLSKATESDELRAAVLEVAKGGAAISPQLAVMILDNTRPDSKSADGLSPRERETLTHLAAGRRNKEIAVLMYVAERTVEGHVRSLLAKLELRNRVDLARYAIEKRIGRSD